MSLKILGISAYYHDSAACLLVDGQICAAAQEERFTRIKHDAAFPARAISFCLDFSKTQANEIDHVVFYDKPLLKFERLIETYLAFAPRGFSTFAQSLPLWVNEKLFQKQNLIRELSQIATDVDWSKKLLFSNHHLSHAASAFYPSPFSDSAVLTMDGVGEWSTTSIYSGSAHNLELMKEIRFPHSLGLLYSAFTFYTGFKVNSGEYKLMGLAPYGQPKYVDIIRDHLIDLKSDGSYSLNMDYFDYCTGLQMTNDRFHRLFGAPPRNPESQICQRDMDIAASIQAVTEEAVLGLAKETKKITGKSALCLSGGVALNCVANGKLQRSNLFERIWIQPASGDAGGALGAALAAHHIKLTQPRSVSSSDSMKGSLLGPNYSTPETAEALTRAGAVFAIVSDKELIDQTVDALISGDAVGWHQGRMEFGPRALGARSILADPRSPSAQKQLNLKVKFRESFRPFAPSVLSDQSTEWFDLQGESPYMLLVSPVLDKQRVHISKLNPNLFGIDQLNEIRSSIPAVTHVDYSARIQTVSTEVNSRYYQLIHTFFEKTGCPLLVNTSFNIRGEPIVNTPEDAFNCFMGTGIEFLAISNCVLHKNNQIGDFSHDYKNKYQLD